MELVIHDTEGAITRLSLAGRLDTDGVDQVETRFGAATAAVGQSTLVDLRDVSFITSMGIRMLVSAAKALKREGGTMVLVRPQELVEESLRTMAVDQIVPIVGSEEEALRALEGA